MNLFEKIRPRQAAKELHVTLDTVYIWLKTGKLKGVKIAGRYWIERQEVQRMIRDAKMN